jgi:hypothetical protein
MTPLDRVSASLTFTPGGAKSIVRSSHAAFRFLDSPDDGVPPVGRARRAGHDRGTIMVVRRSGFAERLEGILE